MIIINYFLLLSVISPLRLYVYGSLPSAVQLIEELTTYFNNYIPITLFLCPDLQYDQKNMCIITDNKVVI